MRRVLIALGLLTLMAAPSWAGGGGFALFGTGWSPEDADNGFGGGIKAEVQTGRWVEIEFKFTFFDNLEGDLLDIGKMEFFATIFDLGLSYDFRRGEKINPYLGAGFSYYLFDPKESSLGRIGNEAGWYAEGGLEVPFGPRWAFFAEVLWREVDATLKGDDLGFSPTKIIFDLKGASANLGFMFTW